MKRLMLATILLSSSIQAETISKYEAISGMADFKVSAESQIQKLAPLCKKERVDTSHVTDKKVLAEYDELIKREERVCKDLVNQVTNSVFKLGINYGWLDNELFERVTIEKSN